MADNNLSLARRADGRVGGIAGTASGVPPLNRRPIWRAAGLSCWITEDRAACVVQFGERHYTLYRLGGHDPVVCRSLEEAKRRAAASRRGRKARTARPRRKSA